MEILFFYVLIIPWSALKLDTLVLYILKFVDFLNSLRKRNFHFTPRVRPYVRLLVG